MEHFPWSLNWYTPTKGLVLANLHYLKRNTFLLKKGKKKEINLNSCSYVAILGQISFGTPAPKSCDSYSKHLTPKFHSSEVMYSSHPAPAFPAALVCCAKVPQVPKLLWLAVPRNALPVVALNACVPADRHHVQHHALGVFFPAWVTSGVEIHPYTPSLPHKSRRLSVQRQCCCGSCHLLILLLSIVSCPGCRLFFFLFFFFLKQMKDMLLWGCLPARMWEKADDAFCPFHGCR